MLQRIEITTQIAVRSNNIIIRHKKKCKKNNHHNNFNMANILFLMIFIIQKHRRAHREVK